MTIQVAGYEWEWIDDWGRLPDGPETRRAWPHAGMVVTPEDEVVTFHPSDPALVCFSPDGELRKTVPCGLDEAHGLTLVVEDGVSFLWACDATMKMWPHAEYKAAPDDSGAAVVKVALDGTTVMSLPRPTHPAYEAGGGYCPTNVAVDEPQFDGSGDVWVSDGYGSSLVHRFSADGRQISTLTGEEGAGRFERPHAVFIDRRGDEAELWIADRTNARVQVYDLDGVFKRAVGEGQLASPTAFCPIDDLLFVVEFKPPRITVLDRADRVVARLFEDAAAPSKPGWPNAEGPAGEPVRTPTLRPEVLNSPHAIAADGQGNVYLTEWLIGGRRPKLRRIR